MKKRWLGIIVLIVLVFIFLIGGGFIYFLSGDGRNSSLEESPVYPVNYSSRYIPGMQGNQILENYTGKEDDYLLPDFNKVKETLAKSKVVKDVPINGKIILKFYHYAFNSKKYDKIYFFSNGEIEEKEAESDITIEMHSDYADNINETNFCEIMDEARNHRDLAESTNVNNLELMSVYKGMIKQRNCLFRGGFNSFSPFVVIRDFIENLWNRLF